MSIKEEMRGGGRESVALRAAWGEQFFSHTFPAGSCSAASHCHPCLSKTDVQDLWVGAGLGGHRRVCLCKGAAVSSLPSGLCSTVHSRPPNTAPEEGRAVGARLNSEPAFSQQSLCHSSLGMCNREGLRMAVLMDCNASCATHPLSLVELN